MQIIRDKLAAQGLETRGIFQRYNITNEEDPKQAAQRLDTHLKEIEEIRLGGYYSSIPDLKFENRNRRFPVIN